MNRWAKFAIMTVINFILSDTIKLGFAHMANGWGGRRVGAGAPKGNNNAVIHGDYCRPCIDVDTSNSLELRRLNVAVCREENELPRMFDGTPSEQRQLLRLQGISNWITDNLIRLARKESRARVGLAQTKRAEAKVKLAEAKADLLNAKARLEQAKTG